MTTWRLNGELLADRRIRNVVAQYFTLSSDRLSFQVAADIDASEVYADGTILELKRDNTVWFYGRTLRPRRYAEPQTEAHEVEAVGPWWWLENLTYQQSWAQVSGGTAYRTRVVLGQTDSGSVIATGAQMAAILQFAVDAGAPLQVGIIDSGLIVPLDEAVDITCAEAIRRLARWTPDAVGWFDYSVTPPAFNFTRRGDMSAASLDVTAGAPVASVAVAPRADHKVPAVVIKYEAIAADGSPYPTMVQDAYPPNATGLEFGALVMTAELSAWSSSMRHTEEIVTEDLPTVLSDNDDALKAWWKAHFPDLSGAEISQLTVTSCTRSGTKKLPRNLLSGRLHDWLKTQDPNTGNWSSVDQEDEIWRCRMSFKIKKNGFVVVEVVDRPMIFATHSTNAESKVYESVNAIGGLETPPLGLAQHLYSALAELQYEGTVVTIEEDVSGWARPGHCLNLTGGLSAWQNMRGSIVAVTEDIDTGRTTCRFGAAEHLGYDDLVELIRCNRTRRPATNAVRRTDATAQPSTVSQSGPAASANSVSGLGSLLLRFHD